MTRKKIRSGGFALVEFAIALPLLILLLYGLTLVGTEIFRLGRNQLADYVLEEEAHYVLERITHQARAARKIEAVDTYANSWKIEYNTLANSGTVQTIDDVHEQQFYLTYGRQVTYDTRIPTLYAKRHNDGSFLNPITGANSFGETKINQLKCSVSDKNVLHVTLEMESLVTGRKIKFNTAVFMPAYGKSS